MRKISLLLPVLIACLTTLGYAQDAALREKVNKLDGYVQDLIAANAELQKKINGLARELDEVKAKSAAQPEAVATKEELRDYAKKLQEIDEKREADKKLILREIENLESTIKRTATAPVPPSGGSGRVERGYEHTIRSGETISAVVQAYRDSGIKVTVDDVLKANPGLEPTKLKVGQVIFIPSPGGN